MSKYRTAMGKMIDMDALAAKNEHVRAVGNMKVNARGDLIDDRGNIIKPVTERVNEHYNKTVGNRSAQVVKKSPQTKPQINQSIPKVDLKELNDLERELEDDLESDLEVEKIKEQEIKNHGNN